MPSSEDFLLIKYIDRARRLAKELKNDNKTERKWRRIAQSYHRSQLCVYFSDLFFSLFNFSFLLLSPLADLNADYMDLGFGHGNSMSGGASSRTKRMRTSFKHHQLRTMKSYFAINHNPDAKDLKQLSQKTGLPKRVLQVSKEHYHICKRRTSCVIVTHWRFVINFQLASRSCCAVVDDQDEELCNLHNSCWPFVWQCWLTGSPQADLSCTLYSSTFFSSLLLCMHHLKRWYARL